MLTVLAVRGLVTGGSTDSRLDLDLYSALAVGHGLMVLFYYRDVYRNPSVPDHLRSFWGIVVFVGMAFGQLAYFYRYLYARRGHHTSHPP